MATNVTPSSGLEYTLVPDGTSTGAEIPPANQSYPYPGSQTPYTWTPVTISYSESPAMNGYRVQARYKNVTYVPGSSGDPSAVPPVPATDASYTYSYIQWHLVSQTLTCTSHGSGNPFESSTGNEYITASNALYGPTTSSPTASGSDAIAGITDGEKYNYFKVFDQSDVGFIAGLSAYNAVPIENQSVPTTPYAPDANPPTYPTDTVTNFVPDERESVTTTYSLTTIYNLITDPSDPNYNAYHFSDTITFSQTVNQNIPSSWGPALKELVNRSYYKHNLNPWMPDPRDPPRPVPGITVDGAPDYNNAT